MLDPTFPTPSTACRTPPPATSATSPSTPPSGSSPSRPGVGPQIARSCIVCGASLAGKRKEARACGNRCRITLCRQKRHAALLERLVVAEQALSTAAAAVAALRTIADMGPHVTSTMKVGGVS